MQMDERTYIKDLKEHIGEEVVIKGFVQIIRNQGKIIFLLLRDVTGIIQVVVTSGNSETLKTASELTLESVISIEGQVKEEKQAPEGFEVEAKKIEILSEAMPELPIPVVVEKGGEETEQNKRYDWRWIDLRKQDKLKIFKVWTALEKGVRGYFDEEGFIQVYSPNIMSSPSESGAEVFEVKYFDRKAYLAQSPQFYKQMAMASGFEKVFITGPLFRAEPSYTTRHMTEFTGWDFEISYIHSHHDVMDVHEKMIVAGMLKVKEELGDEVDIEIPDLPFPKITMAEAKEKLKNAGVKSERLLDISAEEEKELGIMMKEETGNDFFWLIDYPFEVRPFYHMKHEDDKSLTKSFDLIYRGLEVTTGAQREHRYKVLEEQAVEKGMSVEELDYYINFFRYGCPPHGGIGFGPGRFIMKLLDLPTVKDAAYLPRDVKRVSP